MMGTATEYTLRRLLSELERKSELPELVFVNMTQTGTVSASAGWVNEGTIIPPSGYRYQLLVCELICDAPPGATSGRHAMQFSYNNGIAGLYGEASYNTNLRYYHGEWYSADLVALPSAAASQTLFPAQFHLDVDNYLRLSYYNGTNADQTNSRIWRFIFLKYPLP